MTSTLRGVFALALSLIACMPPRPSGTIPIGPDVVASVVVVFKKSTDRASIEDFSRVVAHGAETSRGTPLASGVCDYLRVQAFQTREGYDMVALTFCSTASEADRQAIISKSSAHPAVLKVVENKAPDQVVIMDPPPN